VSLTSAVTSLGRLSLMAKCEVGTYCGVFRRQALDRGAHILTVDHIVTGHNADDVAETVLMNGMFTLAASLSGRG